MKRLITFGGKGGVGKTTCSAATALALAASGRKTLIITSDATPSLADIFEQEIGSAVRRTDKNLFALEINESTISEKWKKKFGPDFYEILSHLIDIEALDADSRHQLLDYIGSAPSLREETMLDLIVDFAEFGSYDSIVWDTAPAGETLNLLNMPGYIKNHLSAGAKVFEGLDKIGKKILGKRSISGIMDEWIAASERISAFLKKEAAFIVVANPEPLVVSQTRRIIENLRSYEIHLQGLVINRALENGPAPLCELRENQRPHLEELLKAAAGVRVAIVPFSFRSLQGKRALGEVGQLLVRELKLLASG